MKTFTHVKDHYVCFKTGFGHARKISELQDEEHKKYFFYGDPNIGSLVGLSNLSSLPGNYLSKARDLFQAQACVAELIIKDNTYTGFSFDSREIMREIGVENLPLLLGFFDDPNTKWALEEVLKYG